MARVGMPDMGYLLWSCNLRPQYVGSGPFMSEATPGAFVGGEAPVNPYSLLGAVNESAASARTGWMIFVAVMSYLLVTVASVDHRDLLIAGDVTLPILNVAIDLARFFVIAPLVLVAFQFGMIAQLVVLAKKAHELDNALRILEATDRRTHPLRLELGSFFLLQAIAGPERSRVVAVLVHGLAWLTVAVLPVLALLFVQLAFLPYHDVTITAVHRVALLADVVLLALTGVFLARPEASLGTALSRMSRTRPVAMLAAVVLVVGVAVVSLFWATIPGERLDRISHAFSGRGIKDGTLGAGKGDGKLFGLFERNLNLADRDLVGDKSLAADLPTLDLRHRDLRYARLDGARLQQADLTGANLDGASLIGTDMRGARIGCADESRAPGGCASARAAILTKARLNNATLTGIDLAGARLREADLAGAHLARANLSGADLFGASLERAELTGGAALQGANLASANLQGADLTGARMLGADLTSAAMQAATLDFAGLEGAILRSADLEAASLHGARLQAADMTGARIRAASLREAWVWRANIPEQASSDLADLAGLRASSPTSDEAAALETELRRLADRRLEARLRGAFADGGEVAIEKREGTSIAWAELVRASERATSDTTTVIGSLVQTGSVVSGEPTVATQPITNGLEAQLRRSDRRARLTRHLVLVACRARWANGAVATGVARRAMGSTFSGDPGAVLAGLRHPDCAGGRSLRPELLGRLESGVESLRSR